MRIGVDIGGTFTDFVIEADGQLQAHKLLSTPDDPSRALLQGLQQWVGSSAEAWERLAHGSTVATNAILQRRGARIAFITTRGFRDLLFLGRQNRPQLYAIHPQLPPPLLSRERCFEVSERLDHRGEVITTLDENELSHILDELAQLSLDAIAICLLFSYVNPGHERRIKELILARDFVEPWQVVLSSEVLPEFREYERASTVALEAYVRPAVHHYLTQLDRELPDEADLWVMRSDGGVLHAENIREQAIHTALSGPAAGVIGARFVAQKAGFEKIITLDMGGTSTDVSLCDGGLTPRPQTEIDGLPLRLRTLDIETIGAGGGSIARVDAGGALRVGPESAGADPGPMIYGMGGEQPTVSDANAILGRLGDDQRLGGNLRLDNSLARRGFVPLAERLNLTIEEAAIGVLAVANANIDRSLRRVSVARGYDPREFTLMAFGGAGPLHACDVADRLAMPSVLIPATPGVLCALGLIVADVQLDFSQSVLQFSGPERMNRINELLSQLRARAEAVCAKEKLDETPQFYAYLDVRYQGQAHELTIDFSEDYEEAFHAEHEREYGHALRDREIEIVNLRLRAIGAVRKPELPYREVLSVSQPRPMRTEVASAGQTMAHHWREDLIPGSRFVGPALVLQNDCTTYVAPGWEARVDGYHNLILERLS
ncbi:MAG: hydantoinase/oxoprolinase family protein [Anaerolineaceae bacterium]|nr:hydantoinase/oxoprolinase family protein [Anaerolineaceae bacterium]